MGKIESEDNVKAVEPNMSKVEELRQVWAEIDNFHLENIEKRDELIMPIPEIDYFWHELYMHLL